MPSTGTARAVMTLGTVLVSAGLFALGLPSLVPVVGPLLWALASLVAIGLAVRTILVGEAAAGLAAEATEAA